MLSAHTICLGFKFRLEILSFCFIPGVRDRFWQRMEGLIGTARIFNEVQWMQAYRGYHLCATFLHKSENLRNFCSQICFFKNSGEISHGCMLALALFSSSGSYLTVFQTPSRQPRFRIRGGARQLSQMGQ